MIIKRRNFPSAQCPASANPEMHPPFTLDHSYRTPRSPPSTVALLSDLSRRPTFVSFLNLLMWLEVLLSRSFMYIVNSGGPKTNPCGTPVEKGAQPGLFPFTWTSLRSVSPASIRFKTMPLFRETSPYLESLTRHFQDDFLISKKCKISKFFLPLRLPF